MLRVIAVALLGWLGLSDWDWSRLWLVVLCGGVGIVVLYWLWPGLLTIWPAIGIAAASALLGIFWEAQARKSQEENCRGTRIANGTRG
jgi:hypothetical protein